MVENYTNVYTMAIANITTNTSTKDTVYYPYDNASMSLNVNDYIITSGNTFFTPSWTFTEAYLQLEKDKELRSKHPILQEMYEEYEMVKKILQDEKIDKSFDKRADLGKSLMVGRE